MRLGIAQSEVMVVVEIFSRIGLFTFYRVVVGVVVAAVAAVVAVGGGGGGGGGGTRRAPRPRENDMFRSVTPSAAQTC